MKRFLLIAFLVFLAALVAGCCTPQPARVDPKKRAAFLDQTAVIVSYSILGGLPFKTAQEHNADADKLTR